MKDLKNYGVICIYIFYRLEEIFEIVDIVIVLRDGKIILIDLILVLIEDEIIKRMVGCEFI